MINTTGEKGIELGDDVAFTNHVGGSIQITNTTEEAIETEGVFTNNGTIFVNGATEEGLDLDDSNTHFVNNGTLTIQGISGDEGIDVQGTLENNGIINIGHVANSCGGNPCPAIFIDNHVARLINNACGVINVTTADSIVTDTAFATIENLGTITTVYTGNNRNTGIFLNNGHVNSPGGVFSVIGNALTGIGIVRGGPIPAKESELCPLVPTVSQWGLIILALLLMVVGSTKVIEMSNAGGSDG